MRLVYKLRIGLVLFLLSVVVYISSQSNLNIKEDMEINITTEKQLGGVYEHISQDYNLFYFSIGSERREFGKKMGWDFVNLKSESWLEMPLKYKVYTFFGIANYPIRGEPVYLGFKITNQNPEKKFEYYIDAYFVDDLGYILGKYQKRSDIYRTQEQQTNSIAVAPNSEQRIYVKINTLDAIDYGRYKVIVPFYAKKEERRTTNMEPST
ncbi:MAG: hypothetical protein HY930_01080 [Euryarchaeota archaeon]|nr:hypothetical protein [Euryarchaeota archaeon]